MASNDYPEHLAEVLKGIDGLEESLNEVYRKGLSWERLQRWEDRAKRFLTEKIGPHEAKRFDAADGSLVMGDPEGNFHRDVAAKAEYLQALKEAILEDPQVATPAPQKKPPPPVSTPIRATAAKVTREGVFFEGQNFDAMRRVQGIIGSAKRTIVIIDNYISADVLDLVSSKAAGTTVQILSRDIPASVKPAAQAFNKQHGGLSIRETRAFHDRFIIIDDADFYHFGASIKDAGSKGFMFSKVEEPEVVSALRKKVADEWAKATAFLP